MASAAPAASAFRRYLLPGLVFQSVVIAGGYGTGRELVEFFLTQGPMGGLLAILATTALWSAVAMVTFEFARVFRTYDYRRLFQRLLGPAWVLFEVSYLGLMIIILAVIAAAAGAILEETFGVSYWIGVGGIMAAVGLLVFGGSALIEKALAAWSFVLYALYLVFFVWCFHRFGSTIESALAAAPAGRGWAWAGLRYAGYNLACIPAVLATLRVQGTRRETLVSGALMGPIGMIPGLLFFLAMVGHYPEILAERVPANYLLEVLGSRTFQVAFQVMLFGTLIETGTGLLHAVNERISGVMADRRREMPGWLRPAVAVGFLVLGTVIAQFGLIGLIAKGYGTLTVAFIAVYVVPILTLGILKIRGAPARATMAPEPLPHPPSGP